MADLDDIYNTKLLEAAAAMPRTKRLAAPDATASERAKLCGSTIEVDIKMDGGGFGLRPERPGVPAGASRGVDRRPRDRGHERG